MGVCLSCLGLSSKGSSESDPSETSRLLNSGPSQPQYGSPNRPAAYQDTVDPEQETRDREALNAIWKSTSDKLIDISSTTTISENASTGAPEIDFARLFRETFPRRQQPHRSRSKPRPSSADQQQQQSKLELEQDRGQQSLSPSDEQTWLRGIIMKNPGDKSWDCNNVHKIGKPLIIEFDEQAGGDGSNVDVAVKTLKDVKETLK